MTTTTGTATRTGTRARYRSIPPPAGTPWSCRTTRPATDAAIAVTSMTGRRQGRAGRRVSAVGARAGLTGGGGLPGCHTAMNGGPARAGPVAVPAQRPAGRAAAPGGDAVRGVTHPRGLAGFHPADVQRELEVHREAGAAEGVLDRAEGVGVGEAPADPERRRRSTGLLEHRLHQRGVLLPERRAGV